MSRPGSRRTNRQLPSSSRKLGSITRKFCKAGTTPPRRLSIAATAEGSGHTSPLPGRRARSASAAASSAISGSSRGVTASSTARAVSPGFARTPGPTTFAAIKVSAIRTPSCPALPMRVPICVRTMAASTWRFPAGSRLSSAKPQSVRSPASASLKRRCARKKSASAACVSRVVNARPFPSSRVAPALRSSPAAFSVKSVAMAGMAITARTMARIPAPIRSRMSGIRRRRGRRSRAALAATASRAITCDGGRLVSMVRSLEITR